jgi:glycosyltransferase involved in cell wall biosynthesis
MAEIRLALFTDTYAPDVNGVAKTLARWVDYLRKRGVPVRVFAPSPPRRAESAAGTAERLASIPFFLYPECRVSVPVSPAAERKLLEFRPTVVHVATPFGVGWAGRHLALKHGIPLVASHHTHFVRYLPFYNLQWMGKLLWRYLHWFHRPCRKIYVPSPSVLEECRGYGWKRLEIWSRGVDTSVFFRDADREKLRQERNFPPSRFVILYAGRIAPEKQPDVAVEAAARFALRSGADAELVLAGDGPSAAEIGQLAASRGVRARMLGAVPQAELRRWMSAADAMLFPSPTETFGNVVLEAMACGLPVIGARAGAVPDLLRDGETGLLCGAGDADAFAAALGRLHESRELRAKLGDAALAEASGRSWDEVFDRLLASVTDACRHTPGAMAKVRS